MSESEEAKPRKARGKKPKKTPEERAAEQKGKLPTGKLALFKHPQLYAQEIRVPPALHKRLVGLDLASHTGVSFCDIIPGHPVTCATITMGQWYLGTMGDYDTGPLRLVRLREFLSILQPDLVFLEDARFGSAPDQGGPVSAIIARAVSGAEFLGSLKATVSCWCEERNIPCQGVSSSALKQFATGHGNCNKEDMIRAANDQFGTTFPIADYQKTGVDNICDSAFLCKMAVQHYSSGLNQ